MNNFQHTFFRKKNSNYNEWDVIVEANKGHRLWIDCIQKGARAIGLKDMMELSLNRGEMHFPLDHFGSEEFGEFNKRIFSKEDEFYKIYKKTGVEKLFANLSSSLIDYEKIGVCLKTEFIRIRVIKGNPNPLCLLLADISVDD